MSILNPAIAMCSLVFRPGSAIVDTRDSFVKNLELSILPGSVHGGADNIGPVLSYWDDPIQACTLCALRYR